jgi:CMP-N,N'-diacetyllegionaminic acid synthase
MRVLGVIPARGGSKGVPRKNIREVAGKPLIAWTITAARAAHSLARCIISTDDEEIAQVARAHGGDVPFLRPAALATDETPGVAPVLHAVAALAPERFDAVVCLQPTSPLRIAADIDGAVAALVEGVDAVVSVTPARQHPLWMKQLDDRGLLVPFVDAPLPTRRQDLPEVYALNGACYVARCGALIASRTFHLPRTAAYLMPQERSLDIDSEIDLHIAETLLQRRPR